MNVQEVRQKKQKIVQEYGEWTDHNIHLIDDLYTISKEKSFNKVRRILQVVSDVARKPLKDLRILDLACLEGGYAIEFASQGATVVGIEARKVSVEKARFAKAVLVLDNVEFFQDDIRNLSVEKYGSFDIVLCLGVFYHLTTPDVFELVRQMYEVCRGALVMDTYIGLTDREHFSHNGHHYWGITVPEHKPASTQAERIRDLWASIDNLNSVWLTRNSLLNLLAHAGFTSVYECQVPAEIGKHVDRITLAAIKGERVASQCTPQTYVVASDDWPERPKKVFNPLQKRSYGLSKLLSGMVPKRLRQAIKGLLRRVHILPPPSDAPWEWKNPWKSRGAQNENGKVAKPQ
jgi:2-polyprenyl-3-methyl-5-hydroxy-6-metoxy-1,4-benzoquinol methylase